MESHKVQGQQVGVIIIKDGGEEGGKALAGIAQWLEHWLVD